MLRFSVPLFQEVLVQRPKLNILTILHGHLPLEIYTNKPTNAGMDMIAYIILGLKDINRERAQNVFIGLVLVNLLRIVLSVALGFARVVVQRELNGITNKGVRRATCRDFVSLICICI